MRRAFVEALSDLAAQDERVFLLTGDLGFMVLERFAEDHPRRFLNIGVAEQNMVGLATGLAEAGFLPFLYSITPFATLRPYEQLRNGPVHHGLPVRLIGVGAGFDYGHAGSSHHAIEDLAVLRCLPGLRIELPADDAAATASLLRTWDSAGPVYYRLGKDSQTLPSALRVVASAEGRTTCVAEGWGIALVTASTATHVTWEARRLLCQQGLQPAMLLVRTLIDGQAPGLAELLGSYRLVISIETHGVIGGLGSTVAEVLAEHGRASRLLRIGVRREREPFATGGRAELRAAHGLYAEEICRQVLEAAADLGIGRGGRLHPAERATAAPSVAGGESATESDR